MIAIIVGAGVCGPVAAMALQRAGVGAVVYERHAATRDETGSYLTVASNGLDALAAIGAEQSVLTAGFPTTHIVLLSGTGKRLGTVPIGRADSGALVSRTIKRAHLHRGLQTEATRRGIPIEFGKRLVDAESTPTGVLARFDDGSHARGDLLIGCDGIHSLTRRTIDPRAPQPRYVGLVNFGGYTPRAALAPHGAWHMIFGKRAFFGYATDPSGGTVWFANVPRSPVTTDERDETCLLRWKQRLLDLFNDDAGPATELIWAGRLEFAADNTHDLPSVPVWHRDNLIAIGDAAHAPSPTSGQGASMAIEDGVVLAKCLRDCETVQDAFAVFDRLRRRRVERIVAQGARGSSNKTVGRIGRVVRDLLLPVVFRYVVTEQSVAWMYNHRVHWDEPVPAP
jgi:2-polyprenyl-6-methoxyphenol hydroxylase-like FAD-dependent oxidoreductase